ncbi:MAG: hypothetical protein U9Q75_02685, partial [Pseudomonadota bacterium]|nr:hypothetical protein [Pseudomonadota bacterium]
MIFSKRDKNKPYSYEDFLMRNKVKYFLLVPVVIVLAAVVYIFYIYDPNPSKDSSNITSTAHDEPQTSISPDVQITTVKETVEIEEAPVVLPGVGESSEEVSSIAGNQAEVPASEDEDSSEIALSVEAESAEQFLSSTDDTNDAQESVEESVDEASIPAGVDVSTEGATISASADDSIDELATSSAVETSIDKPVVSAAVEETTEEPAVSAAVEETTEEPAVSVTPDEAFDEPLVEAAEEQPVDDFSSQDATPKRVTYVETGGADSAPAAIPDEDYSRGTVVQVEKRQSPGAVVEEQQTKNIAIEQAQQPSDVSNDYKKVVITSSLSQAASDAGLSANQSARIRRVFKPYLDSSRDLRKGDELTIYLDTGTPASDNDADQIRRLEFHGARKTLVATRQSGNLRDYEVRDAHGVLLSAEVPTAPIAVETSSQNVSVEPAPAIGKPRQKASVESMPHKTAAGNSVVTGNMKRLEGVVSVTLFSAAREAGLDAGQLKKLEGIMGPYIDFSKDVRKGDRIVILLDESEIYSSEYTGAVKSLTVARGGDGVYREVKPGDNVQVVGESGGAYGDNDDGKKP